ncbi:hypothetical protein HDU82_000956 [Entophlyctis luteolus]|nr:hypothetical protein HDU82_000956 [Entophlyctis luteolus]
MRSNRNAVLVLLALAVGALSPTTTASNQAVFDGVVFASIGAASNNVAATSAGTASNNVAATSSGTVNSASKTSITITATMTASRTATMTASRTASMTATNTVSRSTITATSTNAVNVAATSTAAANNGGAVDSANAAASSAVLQASAIVQAANARASVAMAGAAATVSAAAASAAAAETLLLQNEASVSAQAAAAVASINANVLAAQISFDALQATVSAANAAASQAVADMNNILASASAAAAANAGAGAGPAGTTTTAPQAATMAAVSAEPAMNSATMTSAATTTGAAMKTAAATMTTVTLAVMTSSSTASGGLMVPSLANLTTTTVTVQSAAAVAGSTNSTAAGPDEELTIIAGISGSILGLAVLGGIGMFLRSKLSKEEPDEKEGHVEPHFGGAEIVRDVVIGLSDGLTVPFALTAGLSSLGSSRFVVLAGMSELVAGGISMGLGGYLAGRSEIEHYDAEEEREWNEVNAVPWKEEEEVAEIFEPYGMSRRDVEPLVERLKADPPMWVQFMMMYELGLEKPETSRLWISALTIGGSYFMGGLVPLFPYMIINSAAIALDVSIGSTLLVLFVFGYVKAVQLGVPNKFKSAAEMMIVGAAAAGAAFGIAKALP